MTTNGFGKYLGDDHRIAAILRAKKSAAERDERKRAHENEMALKRSKRQAEREAAAETANAQTQLDAGRQSGGGSPIKTAQARANAGRGFGRYLDQ
ncbi:hypothetical protein AYK61_04700 [Rhodococcus sp. SBT000017]|uniref:hypothetical protein n=1 Tax=Rhodococcus sp. SBT000017 TaxID=1803385 RepID=UPI000EF8DD73|nr:hypothetical protein [Rhodococcus sp. SBT000017]RMB75975.1 hypothetical protein AYK61_04700 [Rhodococcus sp. SBT000017]